MYLFARSLSLCIAVYSLIGAILMIRLMNSRNKKEKFYFLAKKYVSRCSGSDYYNYKSFYSIVLMAIVGPSSEFIYADVGCQGRISDGGVLRNTNFDKQFGHTEP
jgi:hypothetical protein